MDRLAALVEAAAPDVERLVRLCARCHPEAQAGAGNLDPLALRAGGGALDRSIDAIMVALAGGPFVFNLGHGILPDTPIPHVEQMISRVRA